MTPHSLTDFADAINGFDRVPLHLGATSDKRFLEGFLVHRNNVHSGRINALRQGFPVLERLLGSEYFTALANLFIAQHPPRSAVLHEYGSDLPAFIQTFPPLAKWSYLADIARLEWARLQAFHAADDEPMPVSGEVKFAELEAALVTPMRWHSSVSLIRSEHPAFTVWASHDFKLMPAVENWQRENVLIWREGFILRTEPIDDLMSELLLSVNTGFHLEKILSERDREQSALIQCAATLLKWRVFCSRIG